MKKVKKVISTFCWKIKRALYQFIGKRDRALQGIVVSVPSIQQGDSSVKINKSKHRLNEKDKLESKRRLDNELTMFLLMSPKKEQHSVNLLNENRRIKPLEFKEHNTLRKNSKNIRSRDYEKNNDRLEPELRTFKIMKSGKIKDNKSDASDSTPSLDDQVSDITFYNSKSSDLANGKRGPDDKSTVLQAPWFNITPISIVYIGSVISEALLILQGINPAACGTKNIK